MLELRNGRADGAGKPPLRIHRYRQRQSQQREFQQQGNHHHAVKRTAFLDGGVNLHINVVFQHIFHKRRHIADFLEFCLVFHHGGVAFNLLAQLYRLVSQRIHGTARHVQFKLVGADHGTHQHIQLDIDLVNHFKEARLAEFLIAGHHAPGFVRNFHGHLGLEIPNAAHMGDDGVVAYSVGEHHGNRHNRRHNQDDDHHPEGQAQAAADTLYTVEAAKQPLHASVPPRRNVHQVFVKLGESAFFRVGDAGDFLTGSQFFG